MFAFKGGENKKKLVGLVSAGGLCFLMALFQSFSFPVREGAGPEGIDTYIPEGFVLVPIELSNGLLMKGLVQKKGVVDLYTADPSRFQAQKAARAVKIIRVPTGDTHFAALIPEGEASYLIQRFQSFYAVLQNPQKTGTRIHPVKRKKTRLIKIEHSAPPSF